MALGEISKDTVLVLASAVHFQNAWKVPFTETKNASFCLTATNHIDIKMMHQKGHFKYYKDDYYKFSAVEIPYKVSLTQTFMSKTFAPLPYFFLQLFQNIEFFFLFWFYENGELKKYLFSF